MRLYLTQYASLELLRYLRAIGGEEGLAGDPLRKRKLNDAINSWRAIEELDETAQRWLAHAGDPIHSFVSDHAKGTSTKHLVTHVFSRAIPYGSFLDLGHGVCICTPQFAFMGMTTKLDLVDSVVLGMELCGAYSRWYPGLGRAEMSRIRSNHEDLECTYFLPRAMRAQRAKAFVDRLSEFSGSANARTALKWVVDGSASPMETIVYLLLCLPKRLGGYGLPKPVLNPKLLISNPDGMKERYPDLFWNGPNIDVEYNSDSAHRGEQARYRDSKREIELTVAHVRVLPLTRQQLMSTAEFDAFAQGLRRMLGIHARGFDLEWKFKRDELRRRLLAGW